MKVKDKYITTANKGQTDYFLIEEIHGISSVRIDTKKVEFEVILRLKEKPKDYSDLDIWVKRNKVIFRKKG